MARLAWALSSAEDRAGNSLSARLPGADAEETLGLYADQNKLTPLLMKTSQPARGVCSLVIPESGGVLQPDKAAWVWPDGSWEP